MPFFVAAGSGAAKAGSAACAGRGEIVRPVPRPGAKWALLVLPPFSLATREVYARFDEMRLGSDRDVADEPDWTQWAALPAEMLLARVDNDLEPAAFSLSPHLAAMREDLAGLLGRTVRMSGSGSSLFTLYDADEARQARAAEKLVDRAHNLAAKLVELAPALEDDLARSR